MNGMPIEHDNQDTTTEPVQQNPSIVSIFSTSYNLQMAVQQQLHHIGQYILTIMPFPVASSYFMSLY